MPKRKIDESELIRLAQERKADGRQLTHAEIAEELNVSRPAVTKALAKIPPSVLGSRDVQEFRANRPQIFAEVQRAIIRHITPEKLKKASLNQLGTLFGIFYDKERLEMGQATAHIEALNVHMIDPKALKAIKDAIKISTTKKLETAREE